MCRRHGLYPRALGEPLMHLLGEHLRLRLARRRLRFGRVLHADRLVFLRRWDNWRARRLLRRWLRFDRRVCREAVAADLLRAGNWIPFRFRLLRWIYRPGETLPFPAFDFLF